MAYQVLARKWRPKQFEDVVGQSHITCSLQNSLLQDKVGHAYLMTGTRGVGKTSVARLFAKALRCESIKPNGNPCLECNSCKEMDSDSSMDVMEIDGASHNGVDDIRALVENIQYLPTSGKYKIYIIDEVHMLTTNAFNALLKTLEEPPEHALFIFATTEAEKLLSTVLSRCQRFDFRNVLKRDLTQHLLSICEAEKITYQDQKLIEKICEQGKGSVRDSLSLLDQVLSYAENNHITEESLMMSLGLARSTSLRDLSSAILKGDFLKCSEVYYQIINENIDVKNIAYQLSDHIYSIVQKIDKPDELAQAGIINDGDLDEITMEELIWIYESLAKDFTWALTSISPAKVLLVSLQKTALRKTFFFSATEGEKKKLISKPKAASAPPEQAPSPAVEPVKKLDWEGFIQFLYKESPATAANLEQGNLVSKISLNSESLSLKIGFKNDGKIFFDYMNDRNAQSTLQKNASAYFEKAEENINIELSITDDEDFLTMAELHLKQKEEEIQNKEQELLNNPSLKEIQEAFNAKIDKVIINK